MKIGKPANIKIRYFSTFNNNREYFDILVVGGGMVGNSMAAALGLSPLLIPILIVASRRYPHYKIGLLDLQPPPSKPSNELSNRTSSLSPGTVEYLRKTGIWEYVDITRTNAYSTINVWDDQGGQLDFQPGELKDIAHMIENGNLVYAAYQKALDLKVEAIHGKKLKNIRFPRLINSWKYRQDADDIAKDDFVSIDFEDGSCATTKLLIGADGAMSNVRKMAGIDTNGWQYDQRGLVATVKLQDECENKTAWQKFTHLGIVALLPISSTHSSVVWSCKSDIAEKLQNMSEPDFVYTMNAILNLPAVETEFLLGQTSKNGASTVNFKDSLQWRYKEASRPTNELPIISGVQSGSRASFPLRFQKASCFYDHRVAIIGDAAHVIHPMAGQGVNLGISDIEALEKVLTSAVDCGGDVGSYNVLKEYGKQAEVRVMPMMLGVDALWKLFNVSTYPFDRLRSKGMNILNSAPWLKRKFVDFASRT